MKLNETIVTHAVYHLPSGGKVPGLGLISPAYPVSIETAQQLVEQYLASGSYKAEDFEIRKITTNRVQ